MVLFFINILIRFLIIIFLSYIIYFKYLVIFLSFIRFFYFIMKIRNVAMGTNRNKTFKVYIDLFVCLSVLLNLVLAVLLIFNE